MTPLRHTAPILLAALFWLAQLQGTWHGISHLADLTHVQKHVNQAHTASCLDCAALAQAGGAPIVATTATPLLSLTNDLSFIVIAAAIPTLFGAAYHSRAPPDTLI